jgi:hypothetical protein
MKPNKVRSAGINNWRGPPKTSIDKLGSREKDGIGQVFHTLNPKILYHS